MKNENGMSTEGEKHSQWRNSMSKWQRNDSTCITHFIIREEVNVEGEGERRPKTTGLKITWYGMCLLFYMAHWFRGGSDMTNCVLERFSN